MTLAASNGHTETVSALLVSGALAEPNVVAENYAEMCSHLEEALLNGDVDTCRLLLQGTLP